MRIHTTLTRDDLDAAAKQAGGWDGWVMNPTAPHVSTVPMCPAALRALAATDYSEEAF